MVLSSLARTAGAAARTTAGGARTVAAAVSHASIASTTSSSNITYLPLAPRRHFAKVAPHAMRPSVFTKAAPVSVPVDRVWRASMKKQRPYMPIPSSSPAKSVDGQRVLVRFDVAASQQSVATVTSLRDAGAIVILCTHVSGGGDLAAQCSVLSQQLGCDVNAVTSVDDATVTAAVDKLQKGDVCLLANLAAYEGGDEDVVVVVDDNGDEAAAAHQLVAQRLVATTRPSVFVNDCFSSLHKASTATHHVPLYFEGDAILGQDARDTLRALSTQPHRRPFVAIVGGSDVQAKVPVLDGLLGNADTVVLGGAVAAQFMRARGLVSPSDGVAADDASQKALNKWCLDYQRRAFDARVDLQLPVDVVVADAVDENASAHVVASNAVPKGYHVLDCGPRSTALLGDQLLQNARTVAWAGAMGCSEWTPFASATAATAKLISHQYKHLVTVVAGDSAIAAVEEHGSIDDVQFVSPAGMTSLHALAQRPLPGVQRLDVPHHNEAAASTSE
jgi:phosphoglycerate kinase